MSSPQEELNQQTAKDQIRRLKRLLDDPIDPKADKREGVGSVWAETQKLLNVQPTPMGWQPASWENQRNVYFRTNRPDVYYRETRATAGFTDIDPKIGFKVLSREILRFGAEAHSNFENPLNFIQYSPIPQ